MAKLTKKQKEAVAKLEKNKAYSLEEASALVKEVNTAKFDASVDIAVRLGVDPRKANQMVISFKNTRENPTDAWKFYDEGTHNVKFRYKYFTTLWL